MNKLMTPTQKSQLPASLKNLIAAIESEKNMTPRRARELLTNADLKSEDLSPWVDFEHPPEDSYGRQLIYNGGYFEMMVMAWLPGDYSAIHDHGYTQWGAVQIFGPADHAAFLVQDGEINTISRVQVRPGQVLAVGNQIVHQMGNNSDSKFVSFHMYGAYDRQSDITSDARVYELNEKQVQRTDGGVFFALPEDKITRREPAPYPDYLTWLRHTVELLNRLQKIKHQSHLSPELARKEKLLTGNLFDKSNWKWFEDDLMRHVNEQTGHMDDMGFWKLLRGELTAAARLEKELLYDQGGEDPFFTYAELYDDVIGQPCLDDFIAAYFKFVVKTYKLDMRGKNLLSIGCGTGIVEAFMIEEGGIQKDKLLGIDISEAMIRVAQRRIHARTADILNFTGDTWDLTYCGLNVFQYLPAEALEQAIEATARITREYFIGDFITPDHIRTYPHVIQSEKVISLRNPVLAEKGNLTYQESEIINVSRNTDKLIITHEGKHLRFMPSLLRLRHLFQRTFKGRVDVYDAVTLNPIDEKADTCPSTRYLIVASKRG